MPRDSQLADQRPELGADLRVEADGRLVEEDELRVVDEAAGQQQAAAHPAGELVDGVFAAVAQPRQVERRVDRGGDVLDPVEAGEDREVVLDGDVDVEVVELGDDAHHRPRRLRFARQLVVEDAQLAGVGDRLAGEQPHRRRLAGAVGAEQAEADPLGHVELEPVDRRDLAEALYDSAEFDCRRHWLIVTNRQARQTAGAPARPRERNRRCRVAATSWRKTDALRELAAMRTRPLSPVSSSWPLLPARLASTSLASARYVRPVSAPDGRYGAVRGKKRSASR